MGVEQQEDTLGTGSAVGIALEQIAQVLQRSQEQEYIEQAFGHLTERDGVHGQTAAAGDQQYRHAGGGEHGREGREPAGSNTASDYRAVEFMHQLAVSGAIELFLHVLLD